ncbi:hypothetical protein C0995_007948 [Termitomyces sp. Mi166|nr:hypothetical protein C0995_007948 [Termitomyces sp. Mi166\
METHSNPRTISPDDQTINRLQRFTDWGPILDISAGESTEGPRSESFYHGKGVAERLAIVGDAIIYVRTNWSNYGMLMERMRALLTRRLGNPLPAGDTGELQRLLASSKEWRDRSRESISSSDDYSAIRLYSSGFGYKEVFKIVDTILRTNATDSQQLEELNDAVFLVELVNVDLFNYVSTVPQANNFQGVVYRALAASNEQLEGFQALAAKSISDRFWAIPLALISASRKQDIALRFAKDEIQRRPESHLFLWRIHVVELETELLQLYRERFPSSVVSTICAVPVSGLSQFPEEDEVMLRGPLFQFVRMHEEDIEGAGNIQVMDSMILTINRDHLSTMELGETEGNRARDLIACLVGIGRAKACKRLAEEFGLFDEVPLYEQFFQEESEKLNSMVAVSRSS